MDMYTTVTHRRIRISKVLSKVAVQTNEACVLE